MEKTCSQCADVFAISDDDLSCLDKVAPLIGGSKQALPTPTLCPDCRRTRRFSFRNDQHYYSNKCSCCDKRLISVYSPDKPFPILCEQCFWSDKFDPLKYGIDFDFSRPFFEQFMELREKAPRIAVYNTLSENSDYTVHSSRNRNCYYGSSLIECEEVYFSDFVNRSQYSMDLFACQNTELCYQCICSSDCYNSDYLENCSTLSDSYLCFDCRGSSMLVGCVSVRRQRHMILNRPATEVECVETIRQLNTDPIFFKSFCEEYEQLKSKALHRAAYNLNIENAEGNYLTNVKNAYDCFNVINAEDICHSAELITVKDVYDSNRCGYGEMLYECKGTIDLKYSAFCNLCYQSDHLLYCDNCQGGTSNCFGCIGLKKHQYCVLNKQYSEEEYNELVAEIINLMKITEEWGEFFPHYQTPFGFNETKAQETMQFTREEAIASELKWSDYQQPLPEGIDPIIPDDLPTDINRISEAILHQPLLCDASGRPFRIVKQELEFYRNKGLPIPSLSPRERHYQRMQMLQPYTLFERSCASCERSIKTSHLPNDRKDVLCDGCYLSSVY